MAILPHAFACGALGGGGAVLHGGVLGDKTESSNSNIIPYSSSNTTHCGWINDGGSHVSIMTMDEARLEFFNYLSENRMPYDAPIAKTLGYIPDDGNLHTKDLGERDNNSLSGSRRITEEHINPTISSVDGLSDGIVNQTIFYSLQAKAIYPWTDIIPKSIYMEYVVPYAVVNEPRTDHRPLLFHALRDVLKDYERRPIFDDRQHHASIISTTHISARTVNFEQPPSLLQEQMKSAVKLINTRIWSIFGRQTTNSNNTPISFRAGLTPRIFDPLSVIAYGHSSCTGLAILLIAALRSVGIPARMAGTPAWNNDPEKGNHSWVEVYIPGEEQNNGVVNGKWIFLEPTPGIVEGNEDSGNADDLDRDPCDRWFCNAEHFDGNTRVFVTRYTKRDAHFPMAWSDAEKDKGVPGEDQTEYYTSVCGQC